MAKSRTSQLPGSSSMVPAAHRPYQAQPPQAQPPRVHHSGGGGSGFRKGSRLHIGCGTRRLTGWINADAVPGVGDIVFDLHNELPPETFYEVYGSHVLEHCWPQDTPTILRRLYASILPGGTLRLSVPDLRLVVKNCLDSQAYGGERSALAVVYGGDFSRETSAPDLHRQAFWYERLARLLSEAGFVNVREWGRGQYPAIDALKDYATWPCDDAGKSLISLNMEADRPGTPPEIKREPGSAVDVSVILGTVDRPKMLQDCIASIRASVAGTAITHEIVVAYGRDNDESLPWLRAQADVVLVLGGMDGAIEAFNRAYQASHGRLICQINDDVLVDGDSIAKAVYHLDGDQASAGVVFQFDRGDGKGYRHERIAGRLHPNQMVVRREACEAVIERIGAFWGDERHRTDKTYGGDSAFGVVCGHLGLRLDSVPGVTCRDLLAQDALREQNARVTSEHGQRWIAMYGPMMETSDLTPGVDEWPNLYVPRHGMAPRRSPVEAGPPLRLVHVSLQSRDEPQSDMRRALTRIGPTVEVPWSMRGDMEIRRLLLSTVKGHKPDVLWAQIQGAWWEAEFLSALRDAAGPHCTLVQWTGDVRTNGAQPVARWMVEMGQHFNLLLSDGCTYPKKLKLDERVPAACGYLSCGIDPQLNPWRADVVEGRSAVFLGSYYHPAHFGESDRGPILAQVASTGLLTIYGAGWEGTDLAPYARHFVHQEEASLIMRQAPLTISMSLYNDMERYTSDRLKRAMASGAVVAVRRFPDMEGLGLRDGYNCLIWSTPRELEALVRDWTLQVKAGERSTIRERAAQLAHNRFTWDRSVEEFLAIVRDYRARRPR